MRLLHTSDWHLGRTFHGGSLATEQAAMIDSLVAMATDQRVDAVLIAGDLFDRAIPPLEAITMFEDAVARLHSTGAAVIAISGNHDSPRRVSVHDRLLSAAGVTIRGDVARAAEPVLVAPADGSPPVAVYPIPYLDPPAAARTLDDVDVDAGVALDASDAVGSGAPTESVVDLRARPSARAVTERAIALVRADRARRPHARSVVVAHTFVTGGVSSDSERDLSIGNVDDVPIAVFDGFDYVALGHLHGPQTFDGERVGYSGSPLPYSFSEERHHKSVRIVELTADGTVTVERLPLDVGMQLRSLRGRLDDLLRDPAHTDAETARVRAVLTDDHLPHQAMVRLRRRFPHAVELRHEPDHLPAGHLTADSAIDRREAAPLELVNAFWADQHGAEATEGETALLSEALAAQVGRAPS